MVTIMVDDGQGGDSTVCEDRQRGDERSVRVDVGDVGVRPHTELLQRLFHEGWHWHLTHLTDTHTDNQLFVYQGAVLLVYCVQ